MGKQNGKYQYDRVKNTSILTHAHTQSFTHNIRNLKKFKPKKGKQ